MSNVCYTIGTETHTFTGLGSFRSYASARAYWATQPRTGVAYVYREEQLWKHGVNYGRRRTFVGRA